MEQSSHAYFCFLILFLTLAVIAGAVAVLPFRFGRKSRRPAASDGYAGGFYLLSSVRRRFPMRLALAVLAFVLLEVAFLFLAAWALNVRIAGWGGFFVAALFAVQVGIGFWCAVKKGTFEWK